MLGVREIRCACGVFSVRVPRLQPKELPSKENQRSIFDCEDHRNRSHESLELVAILARHPFRHQVYAGIANIQTGPCQKWGLSKLYLYAYHSRSYSGGARDGKWCSNQDPVMLRGCPSTCESRLDREASFKTIVASSSPKYKHRWTRCLDNYK